MGYSFELFTTDCPDTELQNELLLLEIHSDWRNQGRGCYKFLYTVTGIDPGPELNFDLNQMLDQNHEYRKKVNADDEFTNKFENGSN